MYPNPKPQDAARGNGKAQKLARRALEAGLNTTGPYDNRNRGVLFNEIDKKTGDNDRDYAGSINIDGTDYWLSGWIKTSKKGTKFMSLSVKPKVEKPAESEKKSPVEDFADEISLLML
jgi:hypothetical protein